MPPIESVLGPLLLLAIVALVGSRLSRNRASTLVLQKFTLSSTPRPLPHPTVEIVGRMQGIVAFTLSLMGFSPVTRFTIAGTELRCQSSSLFGQRSQFIPLRCVATVAAGVHKPISALVMAMVFTFFGVYMSFAYGSWAPVAIALLIAIALLASYFLTKKFFIEVHSNGGPPISLLFKPNVIEGVPIDVEQALAVVSVIRDLVLQQGTPAATNDPHTVAPQQAPHDPPLPQSINQQAAYGFETSADRLFAEARELAQAGQREQAITVLQEIVRRFPETPEAQQARRSLQKSGVQNSA